MAGYNEDGTPRLSYDESGNVVGYSGMDSGVAAPQAYTDAVAKQNFGQDQILMPMGWDTPSWADWRYISGGNGTRYPNMEAYLKDLYGGGSVQYGTDPNGGNQYAYFQPPQGKTRFDYDPSKLLSFNGPDSKLGQLVKAGILAGGAAGLTGLLPGTESIFGGAGAVGGAGGADALSLAGEAPWWETAGAGVGGDPLAATFGDLAATGGGLTGAVPYADTIGTLGAAGAGGAAGASGVLSDLATRTPTFTGGASGGTVSGAGELTGGASGAGVTGAAGGGTLSGAGGAATTAAGTAIGRIIDGTATASDWAQVLGGAGSALLGVAGSNAQANAYSDVADKYLALGAPYRNLLTASYQPGFSIADQPDFQNALDVGAQAAARATSAKYGNPVDNPGAYAEMQKYITGSLALPQLNTYRSQLGSFGQLGTNTAGTGDINAAGQTSGAYNALGYGLGQITQPQSILSNNGGALSKLLLNSGQFL